MINQTEGRRYILARLIVFLALGIQLAMCWPGSWFSRLTSSIASVDPGREPDLRLLQESRGPKNVNNESKKIRMRAYRITEIRGRMYSNWIVLEDVERGVFRVASSNGGSGGVPTHDPSNTRNALNALMQEWQRNFSSVPFKTLLPLATADSIDGAVAQAEIRRKKLRELARQLRAGLPLPEDFMRAGQSSEPPIIAEAGEPRSDEEWDRRLRRADKKVSDYGGGRRMKWKPKGRTPAGRKCDVLTFDGSEEILAGEKSVEVPTKAK